MKRREAPRYHHFPSASGELVEGPQCCPRDLDDQVGVSAAPLASGMSVLHALETISTLQAQTPTEVLHLGCVSLGDFRLPFAWESLGTYRK